ncbi:MAG: hypothetical protein AB6733_20685 [Clostridiaceae bacterium]
MKANLYKILKIICIFLMLVVSNFCFLAYKVGYYKAMVIFITIIFGWFVVIIIHELGHQIIAVILNVTSPILFAYPVSMIKKNNKWFVNINFKFSLFATGFIIPNIPHIKDSQGYEDAVKRLVKVTLAGPALSLLFGALCLIINITGLEMMLIKNTIGALSLILGLLCLIFGDG